LHGLPSDIVSDRDIHIYAFWAELCDLLDIRRRMSTADCPKTDTQPEQVNQTLKQYLHIFCNFEEDKRSELLPIADYANNNLVTLATAMPYSMPTMGIILEHLAHSSGSTKWMVTELCEINFLCS
jgi:hypothetical protein